jgi:hypothetical protein
VVRLRGLDAPYLATWLAGRAYMPLLFQIQNVRVLGR